MTRHSPAFIPLGLSPSFGFGDRIGLATPGHVQAMRQSGAGIKPIFAQQSIREMTRTLRTPQQVVADALDGMASAGWTDPTGADADHLKTTEDVDRTHAAGFTFFTIDPSGHVDSQADTYDESRLRACFTRVQAEAQWCQAYLGNRVSICTGAVIEFDEQAVMRCSVKYGRAVNKAIQLAQHIHEVNQRAGTEYEIELSVDETEQPTTLAEHYMIAERCLKSGMKLVSLAPRFIGDLEKGVDYIGDTTRLERSLEDHAAIAKLLGPYKLSLHSGSDKLSMYGCFARATEGRFHVKTAGTSYLEALRVVARHSPQDFRRIVDFSRLKYDTDKATYHVHAQVAKLPKPDRVKDDRELERLYLEHWDEVLAGKGFTHPGRQVLHCTFGSVLNSKDFGPLVRQVLSEHKDTYRDVLADHFARHLQALMSGA